MHIKPIRRRDIERLPPGPSIIALAVLSALCWAPLILLVAGVWAML